jgi:hypothetical protein
MSRYAPRVVGAAHRYDSGSHARSVSHKNGRRGQPHGHPGSTNRTPGAAAHLTAAMQQHGRLEANWPPSSRLPQAKAPAGALAGRGRQDLAKPSHSPTRAGLSAGAFSLGCFGNVINSISEHMPRLAPCHNIRSCGLGYLPVRSGESFRLPQVAATGALNIWIKPLGRSSKCV